MYLLSLWHSSREPIQQESILALWFIQVLVDHVHNHLIGDQLALVHDLLEPTAELRARGDLCPQHVSRR